jgi:hypothetical protein
MKKATCLSQADAQACQGQLRLANEAYRQTHRPTDRQPDRQNAGRSETTSTASVAPSLVLLAWGRDQLHKELEALPELVDFPLPALLLSPRASVLAAAAAAGWRVAGPLRISHRRSLALHERHLGLRVQLLVCGMSVLASVLRDDWKLRFCAK